MPVLASSPLTLPPSSLPPLEEPAPALALSPLTLAPALLLPLEEPVPVLAPLPLPVGTLVGGVGTLSLLALHPSHAPVHANVTTIPTTRRFIGAPLQAGSRGRPTLADVKASIRNLHSMSFFARPLGRLARGSDEPH